MNIFKRTEKKIDDFFMKSMDYTKKEGIVFLVAFFLTIILMIGLSGIFLPVLWKIGGVYVLISFVLCLSLLETENKYLEYAIVVFLLPYIILLMFIDKIFVKYLPYRGDDPMLIRHHKLKVLIRKSRINRLKFWK